MKIQTYWWPHNSGGMIGIAWGRGEIALHLGWLLVGLTWKEQR